MVGDILNFVEQVGIPVASALAVGWFLFIILKFLLAQVTDRISGISSSLLALENQIDIMNNDIVKIDQNANNANALIVDDGSGAAVKMADTLIKAGWNVTALKPAWSIT